MIYSSPPFHLVAQRDEVNVRWSTAKDRFEVIVVYIEGYVPLVDHLITLSLFQHTLSLLIQSLPLSLVICGLW